MTQPKSTLCPSCEGGSHTLAQRAAALAAVLLAGGTIKAQTADYPLADIEPTRLPQMEVTDRKTEALSSPKYTEPLRDVPQTVSVIPQEVITEQGATSLRDVLRNTPGITFQAGEGGTPAGDQMTIRGFAARTDMFIDGVRDLGGYARDSFNLEQVEVTKGPSSYTAGRGSTGGVVNLVTKTPQLQRFARGTAAVGTDNDRRSTLDVNQTLDGKSGTALRLNAMWQDADVPGRDYVSNSSWGIAPSLAFGLGRPSSVIFSYQHLAQHNVPDYGLPRDAYTMDPPVPPSNFYGLLARDYEHIDQDLLTAQFNHQINDRFTLRNVSRYGTTHRDSVITAPRFVSGSTGTIRRSDWKSRDQTDEILANQTNLSGEFFTGPARHELSAGVELLRETEKNHNRVEAAGTVLPDTDLYTPNPHDAYNGHITRDGAYTKSKGDTVGLYAFDTLHLGARWQVTGGLRWDDFGARQDSVDAGGNLTTYRRHDRMWSSKLGVVYNPRANGSIYAAYGTSFNPSAEGLSLATTRTNLSDVPPEKTRSFEVGTKWDLADDQLSLTAAAFRTEKTNARTPGLDPNDPPQVLAGRQKVDGLEFGFSGHLTPAWEIYGGFALMHSRIEESNTAAEVGSELGLTPERTLNLWTTYRLPHGFTLGGGTNYQASVYRSNSSTDTVPGYWLFSAMAACEINQHLTLRLNVTNLTDEDYIDRVGGGHHIPGPARQAILSANFDF